MKIHPATEFPQIFKGLNRSESVLGLLRNGTMYYFTDIYYDTIVKDWIRHDTETELKNYAYFGGWLTYEEMSQHIKQTLLSQTQT